ncbi:MAG: YkuS family protein [Clostridia bacterium]|nr:YkuS family protein [Clostridia bacterium]
MVVAVEKGLDDIKEYLTIRGFLTVDLGSDALFNAVVYKNTRISDIYVPQRSSLLSGGAQGVFMVCAQGKKPDEIEAILRQKAYGNLFNF